MGKSNSKIDEVRESVDIVEIISDYIPLRKLGANYKALCPFHHEKTPSFVVNQQKQIFHCFGCGVGGNVFSFVMKIENIEFADALKTIAKKAGIDIGSSNTKIAKEKEEIYKLNEFVCRFYHKNLMETKDGVIAIEYLRKRNITDETIFQFKLGVALNSWDSLISEALKNDFSIELLLKSGLIVQKQKEHNVNTKNEKGYYDRFRNRLIFSISDSKNRVLGFGARVFDESLPKYINSPETIIYHKGDNLYGWNLAKDEVYKKQEAILVEGYFDCIMCHQNGIKNVCAVLGTGLTYNQAELIKRYTDRCVILFDVDVAGEKASARGINVLLEKGLSARIASVPSKKDPDEFLRNNSKDELLNIIKNSLDFIEYKISRQPVKNAEDKIKIVKEILPVLSKITNNIERSAYISELSEKLRIPENLIYPEVSRVIKDDNKTSIKQTIQKPEEKIILSKREKIEQDLLMIVLSFGNHIAELIFEKITPDDFENDKYRTIAKKILGMLKENKKIDASSVINEIDDPIVARIAMEERGYTEKNIKDEAIKLINAIKKVKDEMETKSLRKKIIDKYNSGASISDEEREQLNVLLKNYKGYNNKMSVLSEVNVGV